MNTTHKQKMGGGGRKERRVGRWLLLAAALAAAAMAAPHLMAARLPGPSGRSSDAIFVLSGGENRIASGYATWRAGRARELYILGAGRDATIGKILPERAALPPETVGRLHVEGWSENTLENAFSAKSVVKERGFRRIVIVTSDYHLARAHHTMRIFLPPGVAVTAVPVPSDWRGWKAFRRTLRLFVVESWKYWGYRFFLMWE